MKNTLKAFAVISAPVFITFMIFNFTVLKAYADAKTLEDNNKLGRSPAVVKSLKR